MEQTLEHALANRRVGVVLSSAFFGFYAHTGFVQALETVGTQPHCLGGSSAGALVASFCASGGLNNFVPTLVDLRRKDFWDPSVRIARPWGLLKGQRFERLLESSLPVETYEECPIPLLTVATNLESGRRHIDTKGALAPAVAASCALPFLFQPVVRKGIRFADGGIIDKAPIQALIDTFEMDALIIHLIHSKSIGTQAPIAPRKFLNWSLDACRHSSWQTQACLAEARGIETYIVETEPSSIGPFSMGRGAQIIEKTKRQVKTQLAQPAHYFRAQHLLTPAA